MLQVGETHTDKCDERRNHRQVPGSEEFGFNFMCDRRILSVFSCDETWLGLIFGKMTVCPAWRRDF